VSAEIVPAVVVVVGLARRRVVVNVVGGDQHNVLPGLVGPASDRAPMHPGDAYAGVRRAPERCRRSYLSALVEAAARRGRGGGQTI
jgi:hypothetical protein